MNAYKFIIGIGMLFISMILWIPLNETVSDVAVICNNLTTDADTIVRNNIIVQIFYYILFFFMVAFGIWLLKTSLEDRQQVVSYEQ